jgi:hypothetical protein
VHGTPLMKEPRLTKKTGPPRHLVHPYISLYHESVTLSTPPPLMSLPHFLIFGSHPRLSLAEFRAISP